MKSRGSIFVISGPSGSGKSTVIKEFLKKQAGDFVLSVSATTRMPRKGEKEGVHYYFYKKEEFLKHARAGRFLEYAHVVGNYYGTPAGRVISNINRGKHVIMDIDIQGAAKIKKKVKGIVTVFIMPPTFEELKKRLCKRKTDSAADIRKRLNLAKKELKESPEYDYIIVNKKLEDSVRYLDCIYRLTEFKKHRL